VLTLILCAISASQQVELQRAAERMQMAQQLQQRASSESRDREAYWKAEDAYAIAQRNRKATPAELARLVVKP
jgi:hypothetical protein